LGQTDNGRRFVNKVICWNLLLYNELPSSNPVATLENPQQIGNPERIMSNSRIEKWIDCMDPPDDHARFTRLLIQHEPQLLRCVLVAVPNRADARDIMHECSVALWRRFSEYDVERPFVPWALGFVRMEVRRFLRSSRRRAQLTERAAELMLQDEQAHAEDLGVREQYLKHSVDGLPGDHQELIHGYYREEHTHVELLAP
jgi:RNA polymerase sigma-70 factor, ECF subfamily